MARKATLKVIYNQKDISKDLNAYCKSFSYNDVMSGAADDMEIVLEDKDELWQGNWLPEKGDTIRASIVTTDWESPDSGEKTLELGLFEIDEIESKGFPSEVSVRGVSIPNSSALRGEYKSRSWEKAKLSIIAKDIADGAKMKLLYDTEEDPQLDRAEQTEQTDLSFLMKLCTDAGLALKVTDEQVVVFDTKKYEEKPSILTIQKKGEWVIGYSIKTKIRDIYKTCRVTYRESKNKEVITGEFTRPDGKDGQVLVVNEQVKTIAEAQTLAKKKLRAANAEEATASLTLIGNIEIVAGVTLDLSGFGKFDGKYIVTKCTHAGGSGYTVGIDVRRVLDGY